MNKALIAFVAAGLVGSAIAADAPQGDKADMRQQMFDKMRSLESRSHQGRIQILKEAEGCIQGTKSPKAYRECERQEQAAREFLRGRLQPQQQALRDQFQRMRHGLGHADDKR